MVGLEYFNFNGSEETNVLISDCLKIISTKRSRITQEKIEKKEISSLVKVNMESVKSSS